MKDRPLRFVVLGLSITSSRESGHAATYRRLLRELTARGHGVLYLQRDVEGYAAGRDQPDPPFCRIGLYDSIDDLSVRFTPAVREADAVILGSHMPEGIALGEWVIRTARGVTAFYDMDTPATLALLRSDACDYLAPRQVGRYRLYLSRTGGPLLDRLEREFGAASARPLYDSIALPPFHPGTNVPEWDLGYAGDYDVDRQPAVDRLLLANARRWGGGRFVVAGSGYPAHVHWGSNVARIDRLSAAGRRAFFGRLRFALALSPSCDQGAGHSAITRLLEVAACGTPIISEPWDGLHALLRADEVLVPRSRRDILDWLIDMPESERRALGERARRRILREHTAARRAQELVSYVQRVAAPAPRRWKRPSPMPAEATLHDLDVR